MTRPEVAALAEALGHIAFLRSCVASGEHLSADDLARLDEFQRRANGWTLAPAASESREALIDRITDEWYRGVHKTMPDAIRAALATTPPDPIP